MILFISILWYLYVKTAAMAMNISNCPQVLLVGNNDIRI